MGCGCKKKKQEEAVNVESTEVKVGEGLISDEVKNDVSEEKKEN